MPFLRPSTVFMFAFCVTAVLSCKNRQLRSQLQTTEQSEFQKVGLTGDIVKEGEALFIDDLQSRTKVRISNPDSETKSLIGKGALLFGSYINKEEVDREFKVSAAVNIDNMIPKSMFSSATRLYYLPHQDLSLPEIGNLEKEIIQLGETSYREGKFEVQLGKGTDAGDSGVYYGSFEGFPDAELATLKNVVLRYLGWPIDTRILLRQPKNIYPFTHLEILNDKNDILGVVNFTEPGFILLTPIGRGYRSKR